ncbi:MAG: class I SAM-dependent methyltransferase [Myxococcales bacterium]
MGQDLLKRVNAGEFDALDFGCGNGGSADFVKKQFGYQRIAGIELDPKKIEVARSAGLEVLQADATTVGVKKGAVAASFMFHFLEHLKNLADARKVMMQACTAARDFVLIRQPFFGADEQLLERGLKLAWSTWRTHANRMTTLAFHSILSELAEKQYLQDFVINYAIPIESTEDTQVIPLATGSEELFYDEAKHGPKQIFPLTNVYREVCIIIRVGASIPLEKIERASRVARRVFPAA